MGGKRKQGVQNFCRIRKAELGQSRLLGWLRGYEACDQRYVEGISGFFRPGPGLAHIQKLSDWMLFFFSELYCFLLIVFISSLIPNMFTFIMNVPLRDTGSLCG